MFTINTEKNTRMMITLSKELKETLTKQANAQYRTVNNYVVMILAEYAKEHEKDGK